MNILYTAGYKKRFEKVIHAIEQQHPKNILELCFGDIIIANYCRSNKIKWTGIDANESFVNHAKNKGFDASCTDLLSAGELPKAEMCIMLGSLYHFHDQVHNLLSRMLKASDTIIISEPVKNLSDQNNIIGKIAKRSANAGKGNEQFRYNQASFQKMLEDESKKLNFSFKVIDFYKKDCIILIKSGKA